MAASYELINYSLRAAKQIERKMIFEAAQRLAEFSLLEAYRYIGFGSVYFSDFIMAHRVLNVSNMVSIEKDVQKQSRFEFNKPFGCIQLKFGNSCEVLPLLGWQERTILWLDYDGPLDGNVLADIGSFCANARSGSMLIVSVNAHPNSSSPDPIEDLKGSIGSTHVPLGLTKFDLSGWNLAKSVRRIVSAAIESSLSDRNGVLSQFEKLSWHQVMSFDYQDGAKMTTIAGVVVNKGEEPHFHKCAFNSLEFYIADHEGSCRIEVPNLTRRELRHLDQQLPLKQGDSLTAEGIPQKHLQQYQKVYRYFPNYAETEQ